MPDTPGNLPPPATDFARRPLVLIEPNSDWVRIHHKTFGAIHFSRAEKSRWDCNGPYGAMCVGDSLETILFERFGDQFYHSRALSRAETENYTITEIKVRSGLRIADIRGDNLVDLHVDARLFAGSHATARLYSQAFMQHTAEPDGLLYNSRHSLSRTNLVLFDRDRVKAAVRTGARWALKDHPDFMQVLKRHRIGILTTTSAGLRGGGVGRRG